MKNTNRIQPIALKGRFYIVLIAAFLASILIDWEARAGGIELDPVIGPVLVPDETSDAWYRLEQTSDLVTWVLARDSIAWPSRVSLGRSGRNAAFYRFVTIDIPEGPFRIGVVGDSTAVGIERFPLARGWAQELSAFTREDTRFVMAGTPGLSSKSFLGSFQELTLERTEPQVVLIQLGQIDEFTGSIEEKATTLDEYRDNLMQIILFVRAWGGTPILVSPLPSRERIEDEFVPYLVERSDVVRSLEHELGVYVVDLNRLVRDLYSRTNPADIEGLGHGDFYHLSVKGAEQVARIVLAALPIHLRDLLFVALDP